METCEHNELKKERHKRVFQGEEFLYEADTCSSCGSVIWNNTTEKEFNNWLNELFKGGKRHLFQVQYSLSSSANQLFQEMAEKYTGIDESALARAIVFAYLGASEVIDLEPLDELALSSELFTELKSGRRIKKKVQFKPHGMKSIIATANLFEIKLSVLVEECIYKVLFSKLLCDEKMRQEWSEQLIKRVDSLLKAS